jgi:hypothetical protein
MKAYKHLVKHALHNGATVSVWDGGEWQVRRSTAYKAIIDAIESVEEAEIVIRNAQGDKLGWALVSAYGLEDDETVIDNTITPFMEAWDDSYNLTITLK